MSIEKSPLLLAPLVLLNQNYCIQHYRVASAVGLQAKVLLPMPGGPGQAVRDFQSACTSANIVQHRGPGRWWLLLFKKRLIVFHKGKVAGCPSSAQAGLGRLPCCRCWGQAPSGAPARLQGRCWTSLAAGTIQQSSSMQGAPLIVFLIQIETQRGFMMGLTPAVCNISSLP